MAVLDEEVTIFKVRYLHGKRGRKCGSYKREGGHVLLGEVCNLPCTTAIESWQESAECIVGLS